MRSSGILMHVSSLPSPYGIGDFGQCAYDFVDFLKQAGQSHWQVLPLGPTSYGDSPYQSFCAFAGNPYFIDLQTLIDDGLLSQAQVNTACVVDDATQVDYEALYNTRFALLRDAFAHATLGADYDAFCTENAFWLTDYALFMALKQHFGEKSWLEWNDESIRTRTPQAMEQYTERCKDEIAFQKYLQFIFFAQWGKLKAYANAQGVRIIGDIPIYVAMDSSDTWATPSNFQFDASGQPTKVAGVPPDYFSVDGQLWGNPLFNWDKMQQNDFAWWKQRVGVAAKLFDITRIDHFRGLESYYAIDADAITAKDGTWEKGPGMALIKALKAEFPDISIIAEDLGFITPEVKALLDGSGFPGMKVLQFAFDAREPGEYLPHNYPANSVVYTGTHDNTTIMDWFDDATADDVAFAKEYLGINEKEGLHWGMIRGAMASGADLCVVPMQDYLALGKEARTNTPSTLGGNWIWRAKPSDFTDALAKKINRVTLIYGRLGNHASM